MSRTRKTCLLLLIGAVILAGISVTGCGQKGDLYLPDKSQQPAKKKG